ncbi:hypothetical protein P12x_002748 [Tundrisphaera lichenicola]|uniref:hypothetical protein n=1 Tax=Tundrisphaera lichenicola TaxID=2029860 RepID=UPI003EBE5A0C
MLEVYSIAEKQGALFMNFGGGGIPLFVNAATYPIELFLDARTLRDQAKTHRNRQNPNIPSPEERVYSRSSIFMAYNFLECLLIELAQDYITNGAGVGHSYAPTIDQKLRSRTANISKTASDWTRNLLRADVTTTPEFTEFLTITYFRNQLIHPKLIPVSTGDLTQDQLLRRANEEEAAWVLGQICRMATALYQAFGTGVPPEVTAEACSVPPIRPPQL